MEYQGQSKNYSSVNIATGYAPPQQGYPTNPTDVEASPIRDGVTTAEQALSDIHERISVLEKRLDTVLKPMPPQGVTGASVSPARPPCSHVMGRLDILNEGFGAVVARLRELTARVEV